MQVPHSNCSEIPKKSNILRVSERPARYHKDIMQVQGSRNHRRSYDARPRTFAVEYPAKDEYIQFYGIPKGKKCVNDV